MRGFVLSLFLFVAVLIPKIGMAQVSYQPTPPPQVTAASESWQLSGEPVFYEGNYYYPAGPTVFFDGNVMRRTGVYKGIPIYWDTTLAPYSVVFVPIGRTVMRPYERKREGELAGTTGSRAPSFPIQRDAELSAASGTVGIQTPPRYTDAPAVYPEAAQGVSTSGVIVFRASISKNGDVTTTPAPPAAAPAPPAAAAPAPPASTSMQSVIRPAGTDGVWIEFDGARWYSSGASVSYDARRFTPIGNYRGFPVYRDPAGNADRIFVTVVPNGPVAPFVRR